jgi:hypothetical protein
LEELKLEDEHMEPLCAVLEARLAAGCMQLRALDLCLTVPHTALESSPHGMEHLLASEALRELEEFSLGRMEEYGRASCGRQGFLHTADVALIGDWLLQRGHLKRFEISGEVLGPVPESFLAAIRGGALSLTRVLGARHATRSRDEGDELIFRACSDSRS